MFGKEKGDFTSNQKLLITCKELSPFILNNYHTSCYTQLKISVISLNGSKCYVIADAFIKSPFSGSVFRLSTFCLGRRGRVIGTSGRLPLLVCNFIWSLSEFWMKFLGELIHRLRIKCVDGVVQYANVCNTITVTI